MDNILTCEICKLKFDDNLRLPLTLTCTDTICKTCLENLKKVKVNKCPKCNRDVKLINMNISQLIPNNKILEILNQKKDKKDYKKIKDIKDSRSLKELPKNYKKQNSDSCSSSNSNIYTDESKSNQSEEEYESIEEGDENDSERDEENSQEEVKSNSQLNSAYSDRLYNDYCIKHKDKLIEFFCKTCTQAVCVNCIFYIHNGHNLTNLNEISLTIRNNISDFTKILTKLQKVNMDNFSTSKSKREELQQFKEKQINIVTKLFQEISDFLEDKRNEIIKEFDSKYSQEFKRFSKLNCLLTNSMNETNKIKKVSEQLEFFVKNHSDATVLKKIDELTKFLHKSYMDIKRLYKTEISLKAELKIDPNFNPLSINIKNLISMIKSIDPKMICYANEKNEISKDNNLERMQEKNYLLEKILNSKKGNTRGNLENKLEMSQSLYLFKRKNRGRSAKETYLDFNKNLETFNNYELNKISEESGTIHNDIELVKKNFNTNENFMRIENQLRNISRENSANSIPDEDNKNLLCSITEKEYDFNKQVIRNDEGIEKNELRKLKNSISCNNNFKNKNDKKIVSAKTQNEIDYSNSNKMYNSKLAKIHTYPRKELKEYGKATSKNINSNKLQDIDNKYIARKSKNEESSYILCVGDTNFLLKYDLDQDRWQFINTEEKISKSTISSTSNNNIMEKLRYSSLVSISLDKFIMTGGCKINDEEASNLCLELNIFNKDRDLKSEISVNSKVIFKGLKGMNKHRYAHSSLIINNYIYVLGGFDHKDDQKTHPSTLKACEKYSIKDNKWIDIAYLNTARAFFGTCIVNRESIFSFGGFSDEQILNSIEKYDILADTWISYFIRLPEKLAKMGVVNYNSRKIIIMGGIDSSYRIVNKVMEFDLLTNKFRNLNDMLYARSFNQSAILFDNYVYAIGNNPESNCERIDLAKDEWETIESYSNVMRNRRQNELYNFCFSVSLQNNSQ